MSAMVEKERTEQRQLRMVRADLNPHRMRTWMKSRGFADPDHGMHCLINESFGPALAPKPFRVTLHPRTGALAFHGYTKTGTEELRDAASAYQGPAQAGVLDPGSIQGKEMPRDWETGRRLGFELRIRPVIRINQEHENMSPATKHFIALGMVQPKNERDAYQWDRMKREYHGEEPRQRLEVYTEWLQARFEQAGGAEVASGDMVITSFRSNKAIRRASGKPVSGPDATVGGVLTIAGPEAFGQMIEHGVGRHRSYGFGMILLRPMEKLLGERR